MPRIQPVDRDAATPEVRALYDGIVSERGRITNMKATLLHSPPAFHALMEWYTLRDVVQPWLGDRLVNLFSHAISAETDCLICSTFFRRLLKDAGEDVDDLRLDEREQMVVEFGRCLATPFARVPDELYVRLSAAFTDQQIIELTAFGAMMVATNVLNNALDVDLDGYLEPYRKGGAATKAEA